MSSNSIGILGVGTYLPTEVRTNDWWPDHVTRRWKERALIATERARAEVASAPTEAARQAAEAILKIAEDPFQGSRERRVMRADMKASDMETFAAKEAISRAGIEPAEIDLVLSYTMIPDFINVPTACVVHGNLGLNERCTTMGVDAVCNSFLMQLTLAQSLIKSGVARYALLTQSSAITRLPPSGEVIDAACGDAASAVIVGPVSEGRGIISYSHHTDGTKWGALVCGVPGGHWSDGKAIAYAEDNKASANMFVRLAQRAGQVVGEALDSAGLSPDDVRFFASHQGLKWLRPLAQEAARLKNARFVDHFPFTGTVSAVNLPLQLAIAEKDGLVAPGDLVACFQGGTGMTWSGMALRWGT
jgi:3-oxoacyl-[acyl-carrier-protein] synthase-3